MDSAIGTCADSTVFASDAKLLELRAGVLFLLRRELRQAAQAEDLCNEAFRIAIERLGRQSLADPTRIAAFLAQTARKLVMANRRKVERQQTATGEQRAIEGFADVESEPDTKLQSQLRARAVRQMLQELRHSRDRQLLVRYYLDDEDIADICRDLGLSQTHFHKIAHRARMRFRSLLARRFDSPDLL